MRRILPIVYGKNQYASGSGRRNDLLKGRGGECERLFAQGMHATRASFQDNPVVHRWRGANIDKIEFFMIEQSLKVFIAAYSR